MAAAACPSSSSSSSFALASRRKYDVFLSFRGLDTRENFTSHLYAALCCKGIETYIDDRLERGDEISRALIGAIEDSKISVIVFSENYASSTWCLDELLHILRCKESNGQLVLPVFYGINPSHVRKQEGSYASAFAKLEKRFKDRAGKVQAWKAALNIAANISGWDSSVTRPESKLIEIIVEDILRKLNNISPIIDHSKGLVGINRQIEAIESLIHLGSADVRIVGIWGMGGIGKTTLANVIYNRLSSQFEGCCFLSNVREESERHSLLNLRDRLLGELLQERHLNMSIRSLQSSFVKERLGRKKVLIVLDDVTDVEQFECLTGDPEWFGYGSRIIVTTRDVQVLRNIVADGIYTVEELNDDEALQLFCSKAFKRNPPTNDDIELSKKVVSHAKGIPLALVVLGSYLHCKSKDIWESALSKLNKVPHSKIQKVLRISYDGLDPDQKEIFLDIACFLKGENIKTVERILDSCGFSTKIEIDILIDNALITTVNNEIQMHDLLQEMGQEIVRQESIKEPGNRSRLCTMEDVCHVFRTDTGTAAVEGIFFDMSKIQPLEMSPAIFNKMSKLRLLKIFNSDSVEGCKVYLPQGLKSFPGALRYLHWDGYPLKSMPSKFTLENLVELKMPSSQVEQLWYGVQDLMSLKKIDLSHCEHLTNIPNLSKALNIEVIHLAGCLSLDRFPELPSSTKLLYLGETAIEQVPSSVEYLDNLSSLDLRDCRRLESLPTSICKLKSLESLDLSGCSKLKDFPEILEPMESLMFLYLQETAIKELSSSFENLIRLEVLSLDMCQNLVFVHENIFSLTHLGHLLLPGCSKLDNLPSLSSCFQHLTYLDLSDCGLLAIPEWLGLLSSLERLDLTGNNIDSIPPSIKQLSSLIYLDISNCKNLCSLPELSQSLRVFLAQGCTSLEAVPSSKTSLSQGWNQLRDDGKHFVFLNCLKLDQNSRNNIMDDAEIRILCMAKACWSKRASVDSNGTICIGNEIPAWFSCQSEGSSIHIKLPPHWGDKTFMGFALCIVAAFEDYDFNEHSLDFRCECHFKANSGENCRFNIGFSGTGGRLDDSRIINSDHVFLWYDYGLKNQQAGIFTEASFGFYPTDNVYRRAVTSCKVKKCGIHLLYVQDAEKFGFVDNDRVLEESYAYTDQPQPSGSNIVTIEAEKDEEEPQSEEKYMRKSSFCDCFSFFLGSSD